MPFTHLTVILGLFALGQSPAEGNETCIWVSDLTESDQGVTISKQQSRILDALTSKRNEIELAPKGKLSELRGTNLSWVPVSDDKSAGESVPLIRDMNRNDPLPTVKMLDDGIRKIDLIMKQAKPKNAKGSYTLSTIQKHGKNGAVLLLYGDLAVEEENLHFETGKIGSECPKLKTSLARIAKNQSFKIKLEQTTSNIVKDTKRRSEIFSCWKDTIASLGLEADNTQCGILGKLSAI